MKLSSLSVFFPFWNEQDNIENVVENALKVVDQIADKWEIIIVDDGSEDKTLEKAQKLAKLHKNIVVVSHTPNRGYGAALKEGFSHARYEYVVFNDGDGQFDFSEVTKFADKIQSCDLVIGYRKKRQDHLMRHILMNLLKIWDFMLFRLHVRDIDCGFKMFRKTALDSIGTLRSEGAMITTEILVKAKRKKLKMGEVEVSHFRRKHGSSTGGNIPVVMRAMLESLMLYWDIHNKRF